MCGLCCDRGFCKFLEVRLGIKRRGSRISDANIANSYLVSNAPIKIYINRTHTSDRKFQKLGPRMLKLT